MSDSSARAARALLAAAALMTFHTSSAVANGGLNVSVALQYTQPAIGQGGAQALLTNVSGQSVIVGPKDVMIYMRRTSAPPTGYSPLSEIGCVQITSGRSDTLEVTDLHGNPVAVPTSQPIAVQPSRAPVSGDDIVPSGKSAFVGFHNLMNAACNPLARQFHVDMYTHVKFRFIDGGEGDVDSPVIHIVGP